MAMEAILAQQSGKIQLHASRIQLLLGTTGKKADIPIKPLRTQF